MAAALLAATALAGAAQFSNNVINGSTQNWSNPGTWTVVGFDADGVPDADDVVTLYPAPWPYGLTVNLDVPWAADTIDVVADTGNDCNLNLQYSGIVRVLNWNRTAPNYSWRLNGSGSAVLTVTEFHDTGLYPARLTPFGTVSDTMSFAGPAVVEYNTAGPSDYMFRTDFSTATSVYLQASPTVPVPTSETIRTKPGNNTWLFTIGRADGGTQNWTVAPGSHPALQPGGSSQDAGIRKVGVGDVHMEDVDFIHDMTQSHPADEGQGISSTGQIQGALYDGVVYANSVNLLPATAATIKRIYSINGHLVLDGEGGLQAGGAGNGRALSAVASNTDLEIRVGPGGSSNQVFGTLEIAPTGGSIYLDSIGTGNAILNINNDSRDNHASASRATIIANDVELGPQAYLSDRNTWSDTWSPATAENDAGGILDLRGDFINRSTLNTLWRTEHTTLNFITRTWTQPGDETFFEAPSTDLGPAGPGTANFLFGGLILGQYADGSTAAAVLALADDYDNSAGAGTEAVYADVLGLYAGSTLILNGIPLYYRNGGAWTRAVADPLNAFPGGDGTGYILNEPPSGEPIIPEPASALCVLVGAGILARRRRRA